MAKSPGIVGAILAGGVTSVAFTAILRVRAVVGAAGEGADRRPHAAGHRLVLDAGGGAVPARHAGFQAHAGLFQRRAHGHPDASAPRSGAAGVAAALFHVWSNSLTKGALFLSAGNIRRAAGSGIDGRGARHGARSRRARRRSSSTGMFAVTACPPFGPFFSELKVVRAALETGHGAATAMFLGCLLLAFFGLTRVVFGIVDGRPRTASQSRRQTLRGNGGRDPAAARAARVCRCGSACFTPAVLREAWAAAAAQLFPHPHERHHSLRPAGQCHQPAVGGGARVAGRRFRARHRRGTAARRAAVLVVRRARGRCRVPVRRARLRCRQHARRRPQHAVHGRLSLAHRDAIRRRTCSSAKSGNSTASRPRAIRGSNRCGGRDGNAPANGEFFRVDGGEIHEVAVGPVHAGIIEPGHFRFQCAGEEVLHLEIALGYQHRGIEEALTGGPHRATMIQMETIAGDTTIAHATAYATRDGSPRGNRGAAARAVAAGHRARTRTPRQSHRRPRRAGQRRRVPAHLVRLRQNPRRFPQSNRHALRQPLRPRPGAPRRLPPRPRSRPRRAVVRTARPPRWPIPRRPSRGSGMRRRCGRASKTSASFLRQQAAEIGLVGPAARACGLVRDVRYDHPAGWHRFAQAPVAVWPGGDVFARARVRSLEIQRSGEFLLEQLAAPPDGGFAADCAPPAPDTLAVALVEGWRGEVCHVALTDSDRTFPRLQDHRSVVPQLDRPGAGPARHRHLGFPDLQQELQPLLLRLRPLTEPHRHVRPRHPPPPPETRLPDDGLSARPAAAAARPPRRRAQGRCRQMRRRLQRLRARLPDRAITRAAGKTRRAWISAAACSAPPASKPARSTPSPKPATTAWPCATAKTSARRARQGTSPPRRRAR